VIGWGATTDEQQMTLPVDDADPAPYVTRAIKINAPPSAVWPWIVQMGQGRAGFYSNTWLENLFGGDIHNAQSVHPEWQPRAIGDRVPLARPDLLFGLGAVGHTDAADPRSNWLAAGGRESARPIPGASPLVALACVTGGCARPAAPGQRRPGLCPGRLSRHRHHPSLARWHLVGPGGRRTC
jgi:hypothetical protein